ncbi:sugar ABC transporter substrate-binding protein [Clostridium sp. AN503]|uniref:ABC transporter substrate-binding protein n=1 Tax=Clostridium sp. AN503 TaxID=3160598 RepID=UPI00345AC167
MKKRITALSLAFVTAAVSLAGCGGGSKPAEATTAAGGAAETTAAAGGAAETTAAAASGEKVKLTVSVWDNASSPQFQAMADAFMAKNENVEVELIDTQADEYNNKITVMLAGGDTDPDVIMVKDADTQVAMKDKNQLLDLTDYIAKDGIDLSLYNGAAEQLQMDGKQYTLPFRRDWYTLFYNKDLFDKAGVEYPKDDMTWDEYEALAKQMTSGEGSAKVYGTHNHTWMAMVANWALQDGKNTLLSEDYSFLKPYYEQALRMQDEGTLQSYANLKTGSIHYISVFEQQQCAMVPMGTWFIATLIQDKKDGKFDFNWGVTKIPHPEGVEAGSTVGSVTPIAINAKSDVPDTAWEFVKFATSEEGAEILADNSVFPAISSDAVTEKLSSIEGFPEDGKTALEVKNFVFDRPLDAKMPSVRKVIEEEHDLIMIGEEDIDTGIANMNERAKEAMEE